MLEPNIEGDPFSQCSSEDLSYSILHPGIELLKCVEGVSEILSIYVAQVWAKEILKERGIM